MTLSEEEQKVFDSLENPDEIKPRKYQFDIEYQQEILAMLLVDKMFLIESLQLIKPHYFLERSHETICQLLFDYFSEYNEMPTKKSLIESLRKKYPTDNKKFILYSGELEAILCSYLPGLESRDACLDRITEFAKEQSLRTAISRSLDILDKNNKEKFVKIEGLMREALLVDRNFDLGLNYFETLEARYDRMRSQQQSKEVFVTGFNSIDIDGLSAGGLTRGEIGAFIGMSGSGKSLLLTKVSVRNLMRGKKVLYVSLEMDEDKTARRFDAQLSRLNIRNLIENQAYVIDTLKDKVSDQSDKRQLIIKQFPPGTLDIIGLKAYLYQLSLNGFKPDMMCVDYVGEFKDTPGMKTYESRQYIVRDLRAIGIQENLCIFTALQANRMGRDALKEAEGVIEDSNLADSYGQMRVLDAAWSLNQNQTEKSLGIGRIFAVKHRDGKSKYTFYFKQDQDCLDTVEISHETYSSIRSTFSKKIGDGVDEIIKPWKPNG